MKQQDRIDPSSLPKDGILNRAMREVSRNWFLCYSKLLSLEWYWTNATPFGATDGRQLILNPNGLRRLEQEPNAVGLTAFLLVHEALHALLGHGWRLAPLADGDRANRAADLVVNLMIKHRNDELKREVFPLIAGVLLDEQLPTELSVIEVYRRLGQSKPQQPQPQPQPQCDDEQQDQDDSEEDSGQEGSEDPQDSDSQPDSDESESEDSDGDSDSAGDGEAGGDGSDGEGSGDGDAEGDSPADADADDGGEGDLTGFPGTGACDNFAPETKDGESIEDAIDDIEGTNDRLLVQDAIEQRTNPGAVGATGLRVNQQRVTPAALDWTSLLWEWLTAHSRLGWDNPFNAAIFSSTSLIACGRRSKQVGDLVWVIDTSGSVPDRVYAQFLAQADHALTTLKPERMHLLSVSHQVCDTVTLEPGDLVPDKLKGGGGTRFMPAFEWVEDNDIIPDVVVYLTDGDNFDMDAVRQHVPDFPVLWLSTGKPASHFPFGDVVLVNV